jgi:hypothetical protein
MAANKMVSFTTLPASQPVSMAVANFFLPAKPREFTQATISCTSTSLILYLDQLPDEGDPQ